MSNESPIGLVLSGGGAKGAFQAGVWKAMCELGLAERVRVISGTSVGAINGAAFAAIRDPEKICRFWRNHVGQIATPNLRGLTSNQFSAAASEVLAGKPFPFRGLLDGAVLEQTLGKLLPKRWPKGAPNVYATTLECRANLLNTLNPRYYEKKCFFLNEELDAWKRLKRILASAAVPWGFDPVEIDGRRYVDGGWDEMGGDNIPVVPILEHDHDIRTIVVVRCNCLADEPKVLEVPLHRGRRLVEVRPSRTLRGILGVIGDFAESASILSKLPIVGPLAQGLESIPRLIRIWSGTFAFTSECANRFIQQGYSDGLETLRHLRPLRDCNGEELFLTHESSIKHSKLTKENSTMPKTLTQRIYTSFDDVTKAYNKVRKELENLDILWDGSKLDNVQCFYEPIAPYSAITGRMGYFDFGDHHIHFPSVYLPFGWLTGSVGEKDSASNVIRHEFGHALADRYPTALKKGGLFREAFGGVYSDKPAPDIDPDNWEFDCVSPYAATETREDFAETFMLFVKHKGKLPAQFKGKPVIVKKWKAVAEIVKRVAAAVR